MKPDTTGWELVYSLRLPIMITLENELDRWLYARQHWRLDRYKKDLQWMLLAANGGKPRLPLHQVWIHVERSTRGVAPDPDNLWASCKPLLDCLICPRLQNPYGLGFIVDDSEQYVRRHTVASVKPPKGAPRYTLVEIYRPADNAVRRAA